MKKLTFLLPLILTGCVGLSVPTSRIQIGTAQLRIPKNIEVRGLSVTMTGSNTVVRAELIKSSNDPAVIDRTAAGQVAIIKEVGTQIRTGAKEAAGNVIVP